MEMNNITFLKTLETLGMFCPHVTDHGTEFIKYSDVEYIFFV